MKISEMIEQHSKPVFPLFSFNPYNKKINSQKSVALNET